jgi:hypothetical protein
MLPGDMGGLERRRDLEIFEKKSSQFTPNIQITRRYILSLQTELKKLEEVELRVI